MPDYENKVFYKTSQDMEELPDNSIDLVVTSPAYYNAKDYSKDGHQETKIADSVEGQIGDYSSYERYIAEMVFVWEECERVLRPNGKLCINTPMLPISKKVLNTHHNRHLYNIDGDIERSIMENTDLFLLDKYIWNRTNPQGQLLLCGYPYGGNLLSRNTSEFVTVYVKGGKPPVKPKLDEDKLTMKEFLEITKHVWDIPIPNKKDLAYGKHSAIMPEKIVENCIKLYTRTGDIVLDPFTGSGTTLKVAIENNRKFVGYELMPIYEKVINAKISSAQPKMGM